MPLPPALAARLAKRGILKVEILNLSQRSDAITSILYLCYMMGKSV
jgi:hypothetical protein